MWVWVMFKSLKGDKMKQCRGMIDLSKPVKVVKRSKFYSLGNLGFKYRCGCCKGNVYVRGKYYDLREGGMKVYPSDGEMRCPAIEK